MGLILPLVSAITASDIIETNKYVKMVCEMLDLCAKHTSMIVEIAALIFVYIFKNLYLFFEYYVQYCFICSNRFSVQCRLMEVYFYRSYEYFLNAESGGLYRW